MVKVELEEQPVRNIVNIYASNQSLKEQNCLSLDDLKSTLPGDTLLCGDFNAIGELWGNTVTTGRAIGRFTDELNKSLAAKEIPEEWLVSNLAPVPKPDKDRTSIKGYRKVNM